MRYTFSAVLWRAAGEKATWFFVTVPTDIADDIEEITRDRASAIGSVRVHVRIGESRWDTSLFPDSKAGSYVLAIKKAIRTAERIEVGDEVEVEVVVAA